MDQPVPVITLKRRADDIRKIRIQTPLLFQELKHNLQVPYFSLSNDIILHYIITNSLKRYKMKIATFNVVNSVNARLENLLPWLEKVQPDIVLLQEIKTEFNSFPFLIFRLWDMMPKFGGRKVIMVWQC